MPILVIAMSGIAVACAVTGWRRANAAVLARVHQIALFLGLTAFTWFVWQWNLLGWRLG